MSKKTVDKQIDIIGIQGDEFIPHLHWLEDVPDRKRVDSESIGSILANVFSGKYNGLLGTLDGKPVGLLIYQMITKNHVNFKFMYCRSHMAKFYEALMEFLNQFKITSFEFESIHEPKLWERMFPGRIKKIRTTYAFDVAGMFEAINELRQAAADQATIH